MITWEEVDTAYNFEDYVLQHLRNSVPLKKGGFEAESYAGTCIKIKKDNRPDQQRSRYCVDIKGVYKRQKFVIDAKYYLSGRYISGDDLEKLVADKKNYGAKVGFFLMFGAKISEGMEDTAEENNIFCIWVRNDDENPTHWIEKFASKFSG